MGGNRGETGGTGRKGWIYGWGGGGAESMKKRGGDSGQQGGNGAGWTSPTNYSHINTNIPTVIGSTLGRLVLGKSLT